MNFELHTSRLKLSPFVQDDLILFHSLNTDPYIRKYLWDDTIIDCETAEQILSQNDQNFQMNGYGLWKIKLVDTEQIIGYTGLWFFFDEPQPQLIYALKKPFTRQGYATESAQAVIDYSFTSLSFTYLLAAMDEPHLASQNVVKRLGMKFVEQRVANGKPTVFFKIEKS